MARIQQKRSGRRRPVENLAIQPREFKAKSEEYLSEKGFPSKRWGAYAGKPEKKPVEKVDS